MYNQNKNKQIRRILRQSMPKGEKILWQALRNRQVEYKFRRQYSINRFVVDFYCPKLKLAIEVDGYTHFDDEEKYQYDKNRQDYLELLKITVLRYRSEQIFKNLNSVLEQIYYTCEKLELSGLN